MQPVYLICGVPGSGKTWVCRQLTEKFHYVAHDEHYRNHADVLVRASRHATRPIITECPFGERPLRDELAALGVQVHPYFVIENPTTILRRYKEREGKAPPQQHLTRARTILDRAKEWNAPRGSSAEILELLR